MKATLLQLLFDGSGQMSSPSMTISRTSTFGVRGHGYKTQ